MVGLDHKDSTKYPHQRSFRITNRMIRHQAPGDGVERCSTNVRRGQAQSIPYIIRLCRVRVDGLMVGWWVQARVDCTLLTETCSITGSASVCFRFAESARKPINWVQSLSPQSCHSGHAASLSP
jgi:hypothetical protein